MPVDAAMGDVDRGEPPERTSRSDGGDVAEGVM